MVYANYNKQSGVELSEVRNPRPVFSSSYSVLNLTFLLPPTGQYSFVNVRGRNVFTSDHPPYTHVSDAAMPVVGEHEREEIDVDTATLTAVGAKGVRYMPLEPTS